MKRPMVLHTKNERANNFKNIFGAQVFWLIHFSPFFPKKSIPLSTVIMHSIHSRHTWPKYYEVVGVKMRQFRSNFLFLSKMLSVVRSKYDFSWFLVCCELQQIFCSFWGEVNCSYNAKLILLFINHTCLWDFFQEFREGIYSWAI